MKYIVFEQEGTGLRMPVLFPDHVTHCQMEIEGAKPVSAGFVLIGGDNIVTVSPQKSESLNMGPVEGDRELILATLSGAGIYAFLKY